MAPIRPLVTTGASKNRVDMVFLGDGYLAWELQSTYTSQILGFVGYLFDGTILTQPFGRYQSYFNVFAIDVVSASSGADDPHHGIFRDTALHASYRYDGATDRLLYLDEALARHIETETLSGTGIGAEMRFVAVNDSTYGGGGGYYAAYAGGNAQAWEIALHEVGHSFAGLADEYGQAEAVSAAESEPLQPNVTRDPSGSKWAPWIGYDQPGVGVIGAYEGGLYYDKGIYRPSLDSKMRSLGQPFDAVAREQFIRRFYDFVDPLDSYTDNTVALYNPTSVSVDVIDPAIIEVDWTVDGKAFPDVQDTLSFDYDYFDFGVHTVTARAYDDTAWVRGDRSALEQTVTWTVVNDTRLIGGALDDALTGNANGNLVLGRAGSDRIDGGAGADTLIGGAGADTLVGGTGMDRLEGGAGDDAYSVDQWGEEVAEVPGDGSDTVLTSVSYMLDAAASIEVLSAADPRGKAAMALTGNDFANTIIGNAGSNTLAGKAGHDFLTGGPGRDRFVFDTPLGSTVNLDRITDFRAADDVMRLDNAVFKAFETTGTIKPSAFHIGNKAHDRDDRIIYNKGTGLLKYDADGTGPRPAIKFADLKDGTPITYGDVFVI